MPPGTNGPAGGAGLAIRPRNRHGSLTVEAGAADAISGETLANLPYMVRLMVVQAWMISSVDFSSLALPSSTAYPFMSMTCCCKSSASR